MSDLLDVHHTGFTVSDLERSVDFYVLLGCEVVARQEKRGGYLAAIVGYPDAEVKMAHLRLPDSRHTIELFEYSAPTMRRVEIEPRLIGAAHLCFIVPDLETTYSRLRTAGLTSFVSAPVDIDTGVNSGGRGLYLHDPDGILVELFQPPARD